MQYIYYRFETKNNLKGLQQTLIFPMKLRAILFCTKIQICCDLQIIQVPLQTLIWGHGSLQDSGSSSQSGHLTEATRFCWVFDLPLWTISARWSTPVIWTKWDREPRSCWFLRCQTWDNLMSFIFFSDLPGDMVFSVVQTLSSWLLLKHVESAENHVVTVDRRNCLSQGIKGMPLKRTSFRPRRSWRPLKWSKGTWRSAKAQNWCRKKTVRFLRSWKSAKAGGLRIGEGAYKLLGRGRKEREPLGRKSDDAGCCNRCIEVGSTFQSPVGSWELFFSRNHSRSELQRGENPRTKEIKKDRRVKRKLKQVRITCKKGTSHQYETMSELFVWTYKWT